MNLSAWKQLPEHHRLRLILGGVLLLIILVIVWFRVVPLGRISYQRSWPRGLASGQGFILDFKPGERLQDLDGEALRIHGEPVYFSLATPRLFDRATVTVVYRNRLSSENPIVETGIMMDKVSGRYRLAPLENRLVDRLRYSWPRLEDRPERLVLQAERNYGSVDDFFSDLEAGRLRGCPAGPASCLATYHYPWESEFRLPSYAAPGPLELNQHLRGAHQFYVYFPAGSWRLALEFADLNLDRAADPIVVTAYRQGQEAAREELPDANLEPDSGRVEERGVVLAGTEASGSIYRIDLKVSDDIVLSGLRSSSAMLAFINRIWLVTPGGEQRLYTDARHLQASTLNPASLGSISFGGQEYALAETFRPHVLSSSGGGLREVVLPQGDIQLEGNGVFSFAADSLINPAVKRVDRFFEPGDEIRYLIASYAGITQSEGLTTAQASLDVRGAHRERGRYIFLISIPGLAGGPAAESYLDIKEIRFELEGKTLWQKAREVIL